MIAGGRGKNHHGAKTDQRDRMLRAHRTLDATVREIYECTFKELLAKCFKDGFESGVEEGFKAGRAAGRRAAKGIKEPAKKTGRPLEFDPGYLPLLLHYVGTRAKGSTVKHAVGDILRNIRFGKSAHSASKAQRGTEEAASSRSLPTQRQAMNAYYRHSRKTKASN
jgi:hypothetical protein